MRPGFPRCRHLSKAIRGYVAPIVKGFFRHLQMARVVGEGADRTPGKRSLAMEAFATALRAIPTTICDNAGAHPRKLFSNSSFRVARFRG